MKAWADVGYLLFAGNDTVPISLWRADVCPLASVVLFQIASHIITGPHIHIVGASIVLLAVRMLSSVIVVCRCL